MEKHSIPGVAKAAVAALPAIVLFGFLFYSAGQEEGHNKNQPTTQLKTGPAPQSAEASANKERRNEAEADSRAVLGILKGMGAGAGP